MKNKQGRAFVIQSNFGNSILSLINIDNYTSNFEILLPEGVFKGEAYRPTVVWDNPEATRRYITWESTPISCDIKTGLITNMPSNPTEVTYTYTYMGVSDTFTVTLEYEKLLVEGEILKIYLIGPSTISCAEPTTYLIYTYPLGLPIDLNLVVLEDLDNNTNVTIDGLTVSVSEALNNNISITLKATYGEFETLRDINLQWMSKYIKFEDPEVEKLCISKWSHNGLGVTFDDIKDVTSLKGIFKNKTNITSFNELKYFKSLTTIDGLFNGCTNLSSIVIPSSILSVTDLKNCNLSYLGMANDFTNSIYTNFGASVISGNSIASINNLPAEYLELEYIESTGTLYINTQIFAANDVGVYAKFTVLNNNDSMIVGQKSTGEGRISINPYNGILFIGWNNTRQTNISFLDSIIQIASVNFLNTRTVVLNSNITFLNLETLNGGTYFELLIGAGKWGSNTPLYFASAKFFNIKISKEAEVIRDFIPVLRKSDGEIGMYDIVSKTFFTNQGTGEFVAGPKIINTTTNATTVVLNNNTGTLADGFLNGTSSVIGYLNTNRIINQTVSSVTDGVGGNGFNPLYLKENLVPIYNNTLYWKKVGNYEAYDFDEDPNNVLSPCNMAYDWYWGPENGVINELPTLPSNYTETEYITGGGIS